MKIAIIGLALRFPGDLDSEDAFWSALECSKDLVTEVSPERWGTDVYSHPRRNEPGRSITFSAGLLSRIDEFDAAFFGISPREARQMDPQQRLLLEMTWEALENGGQIPDKLSGSDCAVYIGISGLDYGLRSIDDLSAIDAYSMTGNTLSIAANRISYVFDLHGPSMAIDTACSSSMVALHQACQSLRNGESKLAIAGGVNMLLHPYPFVGFTKASMLSAEGRCKTFDASGDGYVRGEGGAILLLKPYEQALADGDLIHAVILGTGVNTDGYKSGITIPSATAQAKLMRNVCRQAGIAPKDIVYIEAHGTGTAVGDPIETAAIGEAIGKAKLDEQPLYVGSVKSNMGHLEPASGMAGLVKTVLCLKQRALPASLHLETPNPNIDFAGLNLKPVTELIHLPESDTPLRMGVNSFGFGGANAHALLEEALPSVPQAGTGWTGATPPLFLSARHPNALKALAASYASMIETGTAEQYYDLAASAAFRRQPLEQRLAVFGDSPRTIAKRLRQYAAGEMPSGVVEEDRLPEAAKLAFVYSGNGAQWLGMGRKLMQESAIFRNAIEEIGALIAPLANFSLVEELNRKADASRLDLTEIAQPALFAMQVGLTRLLREHGLDATAATGHSVGEVAAAWATGALSLKQAVRVIHERSAAQALTLNAGRMAAIGLSAQDVQAAITQAGLTEELEIAGINAPNQVTLSGSLKALDQLQTILKPTGVFFRLLDFDYAFHSRHMDPIRERILTDLADLEPATGTGCFVSTVYGAAFDGAKLDAEYWWNNIRKPVQFANAIGSLIQDGYTVFLEIGPNAILQRYLGECLNAAKSSGRALAMLRQNEESLDRVLEATYRAHLLGCPLDLSKAFPVSYNFVPLPAYPWQRERHWYSKTSEAYDLINRHRVHPLLGYRLKDGEALWENQLDPHVVPYLRDHVVGGSIVLPASAYAELALAASSQHFGTANHEFEELEIRIPILLDENHTRNIRFELNPQDGSFQIKSRARLSDEPWTVNAVGRLVGASLAAQPDDVDLLDAMQDATVVDGAQHYRLCSELGLEYGPAFQGLQQAWPDGETLLAKLALPAAAGETAGSHILHPVLSDTCFQTLLALFHAEIEAGQRATLLPVRIGRLRMFGDGNATRYCQTRVVKRSPHSVLADFRMLDAEGRVIAELLGCRFRGAPIALHRQHKAAEWVYTTHLKALPDANATSPIPSVRILKDMAIRDLVQTEADLHRSEHFQSNLPLFEAMVGSFAHQACLALADSERRLPDDFLDSEADASPKQAFRRWLLNVLEEDGLAEQTVDGWTLAGDAPAIPQDIWLSILGDNPAYMPDLALAGHMGSRLSAILTADEDVGGYADAPGSSALMEQMLEASPTYLGANRMARLIAKHIAEQWPDNRRLRILELGCGSRALTRAMLPLLPKDRCDYVIAELDDEALAHAEAEFAELTQVSCVKLDPGTLLMESGKAVDQGFDIVLSGHVLHMLSEPVHAVSELKRRLNKGGLLLVLERHPDRLADFIFALTRNGWTPHGSRLLSTPDWQHLFERAGYCDIESIIEPTATTVSPGAFVLLAKNPEAPAEPAIQPAPANWLLLVDHDGEASAFAKILSAQLAKQGQRVALADIEAPLPKLAGFDRIVHLAGLSVDNDTRDIDLMAAQERRCISTLDLIHAIETSGREESPKLWLVTGHGAVITRPDGQPLPGRQVPSQTALWGFGRVIMNEHPDLGCKLVDLSFDSLDEKTARALCTELLFPDNEDEIILSADRRLATRMQRLELPAATDAEGADNVCLDFHIPGQLRNLQWRQLPLREPASDEIEIRPMAVGLNFRDVMYAMGLLSDEAVENGFAGPTMGMELSGTVTRVGKAVTEFKVGDAVVAFAPAGFAKRAITKAESAVKKPDAWSFEEAATVPTVFFTVYYALHHLARLQPGEKVLIHGAAGGVGIAAIQVARYLGAEIFATAGSDEKRDFVRLLGADHVMNSRNLSYADEIMAITQGKGIDVVLNSLSGEAINRNFRVLRPFGRYLELGKRDFYENTKIGLRPFKDNITYYGIDADQLMVERPELTTRLFREIMRLFEQGVLRPLPYRVFPAERVVEAYRYMQQAKQIGKIVVSFADGVPQAAVTHAKAIKPVFSRDGTYLVTGGLGGFGLKTARWLAKHGAGHLVLLSRRGDQMPDAAAAVAELEAAGATVDIRACDVTDAARLQTLINDIQQKLPPLKGIVHAAMVLNDGLIRNLDRTRFNAALRPKMLGAWNLHRLTMPLPLELFVVYSSATTFIGNPGQANYVAANLYLEALIALRRAKGLPGTSVCWGAIGDVGYLARNEEIKDALQSRLGGKALDSNQALQQLGEMIVSGRSGVAIIDFDWHTLSLFLSATRSPRFDKLRRAAGKSGDMGETEDIHALIANHTEDEVREILQELLTKEIAEILRLPPERIPLDRSLYDIGMDSLMGVELVLGIEKRFGINLPVMALSEGPTITRITERLLKQLLHDGDTDVTASEDSQTIATLSSMAAQHGIETSTHDLDQAMTELKTLVVGSDMKR